MAPDCGATVDAMSVAADLAGLPQMPRLDEGRGRVEPAPTMSGNRCFRDADLDQPCRVLDVTDDGVNGEGVRRVLELDGPRGRHPPRRRARSASRAVRRPQQARRDVTDQVSPSGRIISADTTVVAAVGGGPSDLGAASAEIHAASTTSTEARS